MQRKTPLTFLICTIAIIFVSQPVARCHPRPLSKAELLALVAGDILPENVAFDIQSRGLAFVPDVSYRLLLKAAGADAKVFAAIGTAKTTPGEANSASDAQLLQHLSHAGALIKSAQLDDAGGELTDALSNSRAKSEIGFVMGMVLIKQERYPEAGAIYSQILSEDSEFPEVHARLSLTYFQTGDPDEALRQAKAALAENPNNPVAHLNAGLSLEALQHIDAAKEEYQKSLRSKPDYVLAYISLGDLLSHQNDFDSAIAQYKKALALQPDNSRARYNLGVAYDGKGDLVSAIREYREVKRIDPKRLEARQNLAHDLLSTDLGAGISEFRELVQVAPDWPICHQCLGNALTDAGRYAEAEKELEIAIHQDPASAGPLYSLGRTYETQNKPDQALELYRRAEKLDGSDTYSFTGAGRILMAKKDFSGALAELRHAVEVDPSNADNHALLGEALQGAGDAKAALVEFKEAVSLSPKNLHGRLDLAIALEKAGDWIGALQNYHQAVLDETPPKGTGVPEPWYRAGDNYTQAQQRFQQHLADLRSAGKASEADTFEARLKENIAAPNLDEQFHAAMQSSVQANAAKHFDEAETSAKEAVAIAEKVQPMDGRLPEALGQLGNVYAFRAQYKEAGEAYGRQLALSQKLYGPESPMLVTPVEAMAMLAFFQQDFATAEADFKHALDLNVKAYGENSNQAATALSGLARVYFTQKDYAKTEAVMQRTLKIFETIYGPDSIQLGMPIAGLCQAYDASGQAEKSAACHARMVSLEEKQFGAESPYLLRDLAAEAQALRKLGRNDEAAKLEQRTQSLQSAQANPN
jgi:tetratricopeptide (TPR) repeat protein